MMIILFLILVVAVVIVSALVIKPPKCPGCNQKLTEQDEITDFTEPVAYQCPRCDKIIG